MKKKVILSVVSAMAGSFLMVGVASATMLTGGISFVGFGWAPNLDQDKEVIGIDFIPNSGIAGAGYLDYAILNGGQVSNRDIWFDAFASMTPLWEVTMPNTDKYTFHLDMIFVTDSQPDLITLEGVGTLRGPRFEPTVGNWSLSAQSETFTNGTTTGTTFSWSSSTAAAAPVPEPATMLLLGTGLAGLAGMARKRNASNKQVAN